MISLLNFLRIRRTLESVIVVSGLPRSGTSLMMNIVKAGGVEIITDSIRQADKDNPHGYFELEAVKSLCAGEVSWLSEASGKAVKIVTPHLRHLPADYDYKVIIMDRSISEVLASQRVMVDRNGKVPDEIDEVKLKNHFKEHLRKTYQWMECQGNVEFTRINYNQLLSKPAPSIEKLAIFLEVAMDTEAMIQVVDPSLYHQRIS